MAKKNGKKTKNKFGIIAVTLGVLGCLSGGWFYGARWIRTKVEQQLIKEDVKKRHLQYDALTITGFPFLYKVHFKNPKFKGPIKNLGLEWGGDLRVDWQGDAISFCLKPWNWRHFSSILEGKHKFLLVREDQPGVTFTIRDTKISGAFNRHYKVSQLHLNGSNLSFTGHKHQESWHIKNAFLEIRKGNKVQVAQTLPLWMFKAMLQHIQLPSHYPTALGKEINSFSLETILVNPILKGPLLLALKSWRDEGGVLEIPRLEVWCGDINGSMNGTLSLDQKLRPLGSMAAKIQGIDSILEALVKEGILGKKEAMAAKIALSMISSPEKNGASSVALSVTAQDGHLSAGPLLFSPLPSMEELLKIKVKK